MSGLREDPHPEAKEFFDMLKAAEKPLFDNSKLSLMSMTARVMDMKCKYNISDGGMEGLTSLMKDLFPDKSKKKVAETFNAVKKLAADLELPHQKIDVCPNGCMIFWKENAHLEKCLRCDVDRYRRNSKGKLTAQKVMIYLPITPRLQRLYASESIAELMNWHFKNPRAKGLMAHPCDGEAWKKFDAAYPEFAREPRNVRLGLCIDEFSELRYKKQYSCWPVILTPYNLPPWLCMKRPFVFLSLLIPGPDSPGRNLNVYLQPLIEELNQLWDVGAVTYDTFMKGNFNMRAAMMWTIGDFPVYSILTGKSTVDKLSSPCCMENTPPSSLKKCPKKRIGDQQWNHVSRSPKSTHHRTTIGTHKMQHLAKPSTFSDLPYWGKLLIQHNLDGMHIEKNVLEQLINIMMGDGEKPTDNVDSRRKLGTQSKRRKQDLQASGAVEGNGDSMQKAPYELNREQRKALCEWIQQLKFPGGYASKLSECVDLQEYKLSGMTNYDCHVFIERLLPVALKELFPADVWTVIAKISQYFRDINSSFLQTKDIVRLKSNFPEMLCKLKKIFPPAFFNVMENLPDHLPHEVEAGGPVRYRRIYPFRRFLNHFKSKVNHKAVETSICDSYLTAEVSDFCANYFELHTNKEARNMGGDQELLDPNILEPFSFTVEHATTNGETRLLDEQSYCAAHEFVLSSCELLREYEKIFEQEIRERHPGVTCTDIWSLFDHQFHDWLKQYVLHSDDINDDIVRTLAMGPSRVVGKLDQCYINGFTFHTYAYGKDEPTMNYGVCVKSHEGVDYYGIIQEIIELVYAGATTTYKTILFSCEWMDSGMGINVDEQHKLVEVNHTKRRPKYEPFVLPCRVRQVYFTPYPSTTNERNQWWAVYKIKGNTTILALEDDTIFQEEANVNPLSLSDVEQDEEDSDDDQDEDEHIEPEKEQEAQERDLEAEIRQGSRCSLRQKGKR